jgi:hypothetical protein
MRILHLPLLSVRKFVIAGGTDTMCMPKAGTGKRNRSNPCYCQRVLRLDVPSTQLSLVFEGRRCKFLEALAHLGPCDIPFSSNSTPGELINDTAK